MAYRLVIAASAEKDLDAVVRYIAIRLDNKQAATDLVEEITKRYTLLVEQPLMFPLSSNRRLRNKGYRKVVIDNYIMMYRVNEADKKIFIARFFYGRRDYEKHM